MRLFPGKLTLMLLASGVPLSRKSPLTRAGPENFMGSQVPALLLTCVLLTVHANCAPNPPARGEDPGPLDLTERFSAPGAHIKGSDEGTFDLHYRVSRRGRSMDSMLMIAPLTVRADMSGIAGSYVLECLATQVFNTGDGIQMDIYLAGPGGRRKIYSHYFDAGRRAEDRDWIPLSVPLMLGRGLDSRLEIEASPGPQGDLSSDWLALSAIRLVPLK